LLVWSAFALCVPPLHQPLRLRGPEHHRWIVELLIATYRVRARSEGKSSGGVSSRQLRPERSECRSYRTRTSLALSHAPRQGPPASVWDWFGLAHSAPTSDVQCRHPSTGAATPVAASATSAPHEAAHGVTRIPRVTAPSPGLEAKTWTPWTSTTLSAPTTLIASVHRPSRELGPLHP